MATDEDPEAPGSRLTLLIGLVVTGLASTAAFGRVYKGTDVTIRLCLISLAATALAALLVRRSILLATAASAAALLVAIGFLVFPETTRFALPTLSTLRAIGDSLKHVGQDADLTVAPAPPVASLLLAGVTAVWTAAFAAHSLAFRARSPLLALTPLAALLAFAGVVVEDGSRPMYVLVFVLGSLIVLFGDAVRRLRLWGPISAWRGRHGFAARSRSSARGAWRVAAGTLGIALFLPWLLPGFGAGSILRLDQGSPRGFSVNPIDDIRPRLIDNPDVVAFTVQTNHPTYWRTNTLDTFDGTTWRESDDLHRNAVSIQAPDAIPRLAADTPSLASDSDLVHVTQRVQFLGLNQPSMPIAGAPKAVQISNGSLRYDLASGTLLSSEISRPGVELTAVSDVIVPSPEELNAVTSLAAPDDFYTLLPPGQATLRIRDIARAFAASGLTPYQKVLAIQQRLKGWQYDIHVPPSTSDDALLRFLQTTHRGYCQQFAGAMAVLLRTLGYPARVAIGFTSGVYDTRSQRYRVTLGDEHAWVEVRFPGYGWLMFDPTPTRDNPAVAKYDEPAQIIRTYLTSGEPTKRGDGSDAGSSRPGLNARRGELGLGQPIFNLKPIEPVQRHDRAWIPKALAALGVVLVAALVLIPIAKLLRRRWPRRRNRRDGRVLAAYVAVLETAADVGLGRRPAETPQEYRERLTRAVPFSNGDFEELTSLAERAAYAGGSLDPGAGARAAAYSRQAAKDVRRSAGPWRTVAGAYRLRATADD